MRAVRHNNLMRLEGVYESKNSLYLCMELLPGGNLLDRMQGRKLQSQQVRTIMTGMLQGLKALHQENIMHRDIKPENILFRGEDFNCVVADFGLAERISKSLMFPRCGTPGFIAPEIANIKSASE